MVRYTLLLLAVITGWALSAPEADARHGRWLGRFGCAGRAADYGCSGADQGCQQPAAGCAGEGGYGYVLRRDRPKPLLRTGAAIGRGAVAVGRGAKNLALAPVNRIRYAPQRNVRGGCVNCQRR